MSLEEESRILLVKMQMENCFYKISTEELQKWLAPAKEMIETIAEMVKE